MPEKYNPKSRGLYTLRMHMDHLIMFVHPNEKVVPLADTAPMISNINVSTNVSTNISTAT